MAPVVPNPRRIRTFRSEAAFEAWLRKNHAREPEVWLNIYKKGSGVPSVAPAEALDVALCWGWIDGLRKAFDDRAPPALFTTPGEERLESDQSG